MQEQNGQPFLYTKDFAAAGKIVFHEEAALPINNGRAVVPAARRSPFLDHMRIFLAIIRALGLFPMKLPASGEEYPQISYIAFTYSLCLYAIIMYHIAIIYSHSIPRLVAPNQAFNVVLYIVGNLALIHTFTLIPFSHWCSAKKYTALVIRWSKFLTNFENTYGYQPDLRTKETVFVGIFFSVFLIIAMTIAVSIGAPGKFYIICEVCGLIIIIFTSAMLYTIFCNNVQIVSDNLCAVFRQDSSPSLLAFHNALGQWIELSEIVETIDTSLNFNITISLFLTVASGALSAFGLAIKLIKKKDPDESWFMSLLFQISDVANIYLLSNSAEKATKHLGENIRRKILSCNFSKASFHELQQVDKFLQTVKINNPSLHVIGFMKINRRLFCKIFSILATYMIVLLQFQLTMPYQTV